MGNIILISGGVSKNSRTARVIHHIASFIEERGGSSQTFEVTDFRAEDVLFANFESSAIQEFATKVQNSSAVIIATPVYKATYTGALKALLDLLPQNSLKAKVVIPIAIGGTLNHVLSIEYGLKPLIGVLGGEHVLAGTFILDEYVSADGSISDSYTAERLFTSVEELLLSSNNLVQKK